MRKLTLFITSLFLFVGTAWAQLADGVYTISNTIQNRGTMCFGTKNGTEYFGLADITLGNYGGNSVTVADADVANKHWYVKTVDNKTYIYNVGKGQFLQGQSGNVASCGATCVGFTMSEETHNSTSYALVNSNNQYLAFSCGWQPNQGQIRWTGYEKEACCLTFALVDGVEATYKTEIGKAIVAINKSVGNYFATPETGKYYKIKGEGELPWLTANTTAGGNVVVSRNEADAAVFLKTANGLQAVATGKYLGYSGGKYTYSDTELAIELRNTGDYSANYSNKYVIVSGGNYMFNNNNDGIVHESNGQLDLPRLWAFTEVEAPTVAEVNSVKYASFAEAVAAASDGDEIVMLADATLDAETTLPAGVTLNGNGKQINGSLVAGGNLTFKGVTKVTSFNAGYNKPTITIGEGACLEINGTGRMVIGHGATFNITGTITNAKTADKATLVPSLKIAAGASITGNGVTFNVNNAYIVANANTTSKNSNANGTLDFNINNSIWEQTGVLAFYVPTSGMDPVVNFELKNSVLTTTSHLVFSVTKGEIVIDNSLVNQGTQRQLENRSTMTIKNGSVVNGAVATSSNAINPGTIIVENATYAVTGEFSGAAEGTGTLIIKKDANVSVGSIKAGANVKVDAEGMAAGDEINFTANLSQFTGTLSVINNDNLNAKVVNGKIVLVERTLAGEGTEASPYLINNIADLKIFRNKVNAGDNYSGKFVKLNADIDLNNEQWEPIGYMGKNFVGNFDGGNFTISNLKVTKELTNAAENNGVGLFGRLDSPATIKNLTIKNATVTGSLYVGAVVGYAYTGKAIENVTVKGDIAINAYWYAGVIGGNGYMNLVNNCHVIGNDGSYIKGNNGSYIGGIWGFRGEGANKITNCTVTNLSIEGVDRVGGISGMAHYGNTISDCAVKNTAVKATDAKATTVGLIAGACQGTTDEPSIITGSTVENVKVTVTDSEVVASLYGTNINGTTPVTNYVAKIGANYYESFEAAITAAQAGQTVSILKAGTYALKVKDGITITGAVAGVEFANIGAFGCNGANVTFNNVTFTYAENSTYKGLQHSGNLVYNNCTFNGQVFLYGESETFNKCTFNTTDSNNYNVWTYGAKNVAFNECTFNSAGKSVLIYNESASVTNNVTVTKSTFKASQAVEGKAAIEMDSSLSGAINLTIDSETTAEGFAAGNVSGNSLWNNKKGNKDVANNDITVKVGDETVLAPAPIVVYYQDGTNEVFYDMLKAVPYTSNYPKLEGATIKLLADVAASGLRFMENNMVFDLNGHTYTITAGTGSQGTNTSGFQIRPEVTTDVTFKNGTIKVAEGAPVVYMFNNYATNFILEDVTVDCANMAWSYGNSCYVVVSRGNATTTGARNVEFKGNTTIANFNSIVAGTAYSIDGTMTVGENVECGGSFKLAAGATLTAKEGLNVETVDGYILAYNNGVYATISTTANVATKAELQAALANDNIKTIVLTADIDYGTDQLAIAKAITLDLGGKTLTTRNAWGGMSIKNNPTIKNGTIVHASNTAAIKVWNATAFEDLVIDVQGKGDANKTIGGIVLQSGSTTKVGSIKNVTIKGAALTNGIETYNCGDATENVIGAMENVTIDAQGTGLLISAPCGTATNCNIKGGANAVEIFIKGNYSASLELEASTVEGGVYAHDEFSSNPDVVNNGTLKFTADEATTGASAADVTLEIARAEAEKVQGVLNDVMVNAKAKLNNVYYATFADALAAVKGGETLTLLADLDMSEILVVNKAITLDGNGNKLTSTAGRAINVDGADGVKIQNLTIVASGERAINVINGATNVTVENVTATAANYTVNLAGSATNAVVTVKNSNLTGLNVVNVAAAGAKVTVTGGTLVCNDQTDVESYAALFLNENAKEATITATGVTFDIKGDSKKAHNAAADGTITIDGKTEDVEVAVAYISYGDNAYTFNSIEAAIAKAEAGETVTLLRDITASEIITINKAITLDGNGKTLTSTAGRAINVSGADGVTIKNLTINASGERAINVIQNATNVTIDGVTATAANYTVNVAASAPNAVVAISNSTLNGLCTVNVAAAGANVTVDNSTVNCNDNNTTAGESYAALSLNKEAVGGSIVATNTTVNVTDGSDSMKGRNGAENGTVTINGSTDDVAVMVAAIEYAGSDNYHAFATLKAAIEFAKEGDAITLIRDVTMDYNARDTYETQAQNVVINGNSKTLTLNQKNSDWASFGLANNSKLVLNNMTIEKTGYGDTSGAWNTHAIIFSCPVEMNNVTVNNSVAVQAGAALTDVTINEANGYYGLWINGNGQAVTVNGGAINATNGGRGIKIADQYIDAPAQVTLSVDGTVFNTAKKAAVLVSSTAGAQIAATNVNIANVVEDSENFVWVDEDWAQHFANVQVEGATVAQEGIEGFVAQLPNGASYKTLAAAITAATSGQTITLIGDVTESVTIGKNINIDGKDHTITGMITTDGKSLKVTIKNVNFDGDNKQQYYAVKADHMYSLTIQDCTAKNYAYGFLYANRDNYNVTVKDVTVENCANYGAYASSVSGSATFENFTVKGARYGVLVANKGTRNVNFKNVAFEGAETPLYINENGTGKVTFTFEGINEMSKAEYYTSQYVNVVAAAQAGTKVCGSLQDAFAAAQTGDTVKMLGDLSLTAEDAVLNSDNRAVLARIDGKSITLDMNRKKISVNHQSTANSDRIWGVIFVEDGASLTVTGNGTIDVDAHDTTPKVVYMFMKKGTTGSLVIENGNFHMDNSEDSMVFSNNSNTITVKGGTFILDAVASKTNGWPVFFGVNGTNTGYVNVLGGTYNYDITQQANGEVKIGSGYTIRDNGDDTWSVVTGITIIDGQLTEFTNDETRVVEYISYKRKIAAGLWNPLYVPFEIPVEELQTLGYEVAIFYDVHFEITDGGVIDPNSTPDLHIVKIKEGTLKANYPYLIRATQNADLNLSLELENETLYSTAAKESVEAGSTTTRFIFEGTYTKATPEELTGRADVPCYVLTSRGTFGKMATDARLSPFRVFMYVLAKDGSPVILNDVAAEAMRIRVIGESDSDTTEIKYYESDEVKSVDYIFDLQGRRVLEPQKGNLYIINGKKVIF